jgi:hypothetical protein
MSTIDRLGPLLAQLRAQALAWKRRAPEAQSDSSEKAQGGSEEGSDWLARVAQAVVAIPRDDPRRQRRAFRMYLEALLARELGIQGVEEGGFQDLVDRVLETMEADPKLQEAMARAGDMLLRGGLR